MLTIKQSIVTLALVLTAASSHASTVYDFRDRNNGSGDPRTPYTEINGSGYGNGLQFEGMLATAWASTGNPVGASNSKLNTAQIHQWPTGLGSCNRDEGAIGTGCDTNTEHQVDNIGANDYILFLFDGLVEFESIKIDPYGNTDTDRDVSFWFGNISSGNVLAGLSPSSLNNNTSTVGFGDRNNKNFGAGTGVKTVNFGVGNIGNALLFAARPKGNDQDDKFKIRSLTVSEVAVVPVPAAAWLFGSGLIGLVGIARRKA